MTAQDEYRIQRYGQVMPAAGRVSKKFAKKASPNREWVSLLR